MNSVIKLNKGLDIHIKGKATTDRTLPYQPKTFAIKPTDFKGLTPIPKMMVQIGDEVKAGDPLFYDKPQPDILYTAPVSGEIAEIRRGAKRAITEIVILADSQIQYKDFNAANPADMSPEDIRTRLLSSGLWPAIKQRPYNVVADPAVTPKAIFISGFDSAPMATDLNYAMDQGSESFQAGLDALSKLTDGKVHLSLNARDKATSKTFTDAKGVEIHWFKGKHPAGNVGIQIHHIDPINKGDIVWTLNPQHVSMIGKLFVQGKLDASITISTGGPEVKEPAYYQTILGACTDELLEDNLQSDHIRVISGNVLTGKRIERNGYLGYFDNLVSVIREGDDIAELIGWLIPSYARPSLSRTFFSGWFSALGIPEEMVVNTNTHGEHRAFVVTGQYEQVLPMDVYPVHLLKAILYRDFDQMEGLGIYELVEEDLALCEFVCTSKQQVQDILREGLDYVRSQN